MPRTQRLLEQTKERKMADSNLTIVIPSAGLGRRMKSYGPKALIPLLDGRALVRRQVDVLHSAFPKAEIVVVVGYEAEKVMRILPSFVRVVENEHYETTGVARSLTMGLRASTTDKALFVYGDLVFNSKAVEKIPLNHSSIIVGSAKDTGSNVGVTLEGKYAVHFDYGLPVRWLHMAMLCGEELRLFKQVGGRKDRRRHLGHEILNEVIERGGEIEAIRASDKIIEIESIRDVATLKKVTT